MRIRYLNCPNCGQQFYIHEEFAGKGHDWFCPFCGHTFKEEESLPSPGQPPRPQPDQPGQPHPHQM